MRLRILASMVLGLSAASSTMAQDNVYTHIPAFQPVEIDVMERDGGTGGPNEPSLRFRGDYLMYWYKQARLPGALLTTGSLADPLPGFLGQPGTRVLLGASELEYSTNVGFRIGADLRPGDGPVSFDINWTWMGRSRADYGVASTGDPILSRPVINPDGTQAVFDIAFPGNFGGSMVAIQTGQLWTIDSNAYRTLHSTDCVTVDGLFGLRYLQFNENLDFVDRHEPGVAVGGGVIPGSKATIFDHFDARNAFWGVQVGGRATYALGNRIDVGLIFKLALGVNDQRQSIRGFTTTESAAGTNQVVGGILATQSNIGQYHHTDFAVIPELGLNANIKLTDRLSLRAGYNALYVSSFSRAATLIDPVVNRGLVPTSVQFGNGGPLRPAANLETTNFWVSGVNFGLELKY